jgi:hypothetical protein
MGTYCPIHMYIMYCTAYTVPTILSRCTDCNVTPGKIFGITRFSHAIYSLLQQHTQWSNLTLFDHKTQVTIKLLNILWASIASVVKSLEHTVATISRVAAIIRFVADFGALKGTVAWDFYSYFLAFMDLYRPERKPLLVFKFLRCFFDFR